MAVWPLPGGASVGTNMTINNNAALATLGLSALIHVPGTFTVTNNGLLSLSGQIAPRRNLLQAPLQTTTTTTGNAP